MTRPFKKSEIILRRVELAAGLVLTLLLVYLHLSFMHSAGPLWRDEIHTFRLATMPSLSAMLGAMSLDSFPALSTLAIRLWAGAGLADTDAGLRVFGFLVGSSIIGVIWLNARLIGRSVPLISLLLFGFSALTIRFGDSIRPYGLGILFIMLTLALVWKVVEAPDFRRTAAAATAAVLSVQCLFTNAFLLFAICLGAVTVCLYNRAWKKAALLLGIGMLAALSLLPYLGIIRKSSEWVVLVQYANTFDLSWEVLFRSALGSTGSLFSWVWLGLFLSGIILTVYHVLRKTKAEQRDKLVFFTIAMTAGMASYFIAFRAMEVMPSPWYFLPPMAIAAVSLDAIFGNQRSLAVIRIAVAAVIVAVFFSTVLHKVQARQTNIDLIAEKLEGLASKDDLILVSPWYFGITFQRHYKGEAPWMTIPLMEDLETTRYDILKKKMASPDPLRPVIEGIEGTLARGGDLWLIGEFFNFYSMLEGKAPVPLPPAPGGPYGWKSTPYVMNWSLQTEYLILSGEKKPRRLLLKWDKPINPDEFGSVILVKGTERD